jgi:tRNA threonylcarbamoyladenosine biosynthesis protein TsaB
MLLALDTSTRIASVALFHAGALLDECTWRSELNHTTELAPIVAAMLARQSVVARELDGVAVAVGPGSFNGLRVGVSMAKGMSQALSIPVVGIDTLELLAYQQRHFRGLIRPILGAGRAQVATAQFRSFRGRWRRVEDDHLSTMSEIIAGTTRRTLLCGEIGPEWVTQLGLVLGGRVVLAGDVASWRRAGFLAELGSLRLQAGGAVPADSLEPVYLRRPSIGGVS